MKILCLKIFFLLPLVLLACSESSNSIEEVEQEVIKHSEEKIINKVLNRFLCGGQTRNGEIDAPQPCCRIRVSGWLKTGLRELVMHKVVD